jgi:hypothetical protein
MQHAMKLLFLLGTITNRFPLRFYDIRNVYLFSFLYINFVHIYSSNTFQQDKKSNGNMKNIRNKFISYSAIVVTDSTSLSIVVHYMMLALE